MTERSFMGASGRYTRFGPTGASSRASGVRFPTKEERSPQVTKALANAAKSLMDGDVFPDVIELMRAEALEQFATSELGPQGDLERLIARVKIAALDDIVNRLTSMGEDVKIHERQEADEAEDDLDPAKWP